MKENIVPSVTLNLKEAFYRSRIERELINHPGDYQGSLKLSLSSGSLIVMQGNNADISKDSIYSSLGRRVSITFVKVQPKMGSTLSSIPIGMSHSSSLSSSHWS